MTTSFTSFQILESEDRVYISIYAYFIHIMRPFFTCSKFEILFLGKRSQVLDLSRCLAKVGA